MSCVSMHGVRPEKLEIEINTKSIVFVFAPHFRNQLAHIANYRYLSCHHELQLWQLDRRYHGYYMLL